MVVGAVILVEPSSAGNLGAALRVAANFAVPRVELVRPRVAVDDDEVQSWACGAQRHLAVTCHASLADAAAPYRTLIATASGRGREGLPVVDPPGAARALARRGAGDAALVFGTEASGLSVPDLDRCDLAVRIPTDPAFPVLNLTQSIAILLGYLTIATEPASTASPPAPARAVAALMDHLRDSLLTIGFLDPQNPDRILRKLRRLLGRAGVTPNELSILHGICRQMEWARRAPPADEPPDT